MFIKSSLFAAAAALAAVASNVAAHMIVIEPCVQGSTQPGCAAIPGNAPDYDLAAPISTHDRIGAPICKNPNRFQRPYKTYKAGSSIPVVLGGGAPHGGGHCQWSVSYDGGQTFVVLRTVMTECMKNGQNNWEVPIPASAPSSDNVLFQWTWNNAIGNREMYSLCSRIGIDGQQSGGSITGPKVLYANHGPGSQSIAEFAFGYDDGSSIFAARPIITVTGNGASVPQPPVTPPTTPTVPTKPPTTPTPTQTQTTPTFTPTRIPNNNSKTTTAPVPTTQPTNPPQPPTGACVENATKCSGSGRDLYAQCLYGAWINRPCAPGTVCKDVAGGFVCDLP